MIILDDHQHGVSQVRKIIICVSTCVVYVSSITYRVLYILYACVCCVSSVCMYAYAYLYICIRYLELHKSILYIENFVMPSNFDYKLTMVIS